MTKPAELPEDEIARLAALDKYDILDTPPEEVFDKITLLTSQLYGAPISLISLVDAKRQWFKSKCGLEADETSRDIAFCAHAILDTDVFYIPDTTTDERFQDNPLVKGPTHIRTYAGAPLITPEGYRLGTLCVIFDQVTALTKLQLSQLQTLASLVVDELNLRQALMDAERSRAAAEAANAAKSNFIAVMSHEIRTPLNGVLGAAGVLSNANLPPEQNEMVQAVKQSGYLLLELLNDILDTSKIEAGQIELEHVEFPIADLLTSTKNLWTGRAQEKNLQLSIHSSLADDFQITSDPTRLRQIVNNLVSNAIKFTSEGQIELRVEETFRQGDRTELLFEVRDTGIGISTEQREKLFAPFAQADSSTTRKYGGTGLGLSISKNLVELLGGTISVDSAPGKGTSFFFTVSAHQGNQKHPAEIDSGAVKKASHKVGSNKPLRILIAEDNRINQKVVSWMLEPFQSQIDIVSNGLEAVAAVTRSTYDIVLMDIHMPELDGIKATQKIRSLEGAAGRVPIIAMTADISDEDRERFAAGGMNDHVAKPIDQESLFQVISNAVTVAIPDMSQAPASSPAVIDDERSTLSGGTKKDVDDLIESIDGVLNRTGT